MGILFQALGRIGNTHQSQQTLCFLHGVFLVHVRMDHDLLGDLTADGQGGIQRSQGILEHNGAVAAAVGLPFLLVHVQQILTFKKDLAALLDLAGRGLDQTHDGLGGDGLAAAGFTDDGNGFTGVHRKIDTADRLHFTGIAVIGNL